MVQSTDRDNNKPRGKTDGKFFGGAKKHIDKLGNSVAQ